MKRILKVLTVLLVVGFLTSCSSVRVASDYEKNANFSDFKTFAFFKPGIDKAEINDIDKRRILRAIESELLSKGFTKSENPDLLVSIFSKSNQRVDVYNNYWGAGAWGWGGYGPGWGWGGFGPGWGWNQPMVSTRIEGQLFIDLIDAKKKELVWQGEGRGNLPRNTERKEERIKDFVSEMLGQFPPELK
ncbi:MAG: DUF4136 domain-containing protein [Flavobacteriaceae bacterium]|nr:DUF4136 domain-containing protein [Bacteroidia bacterium]NNL16666.1 DUF4136 domain-containing protein [Flavobacteriaceae bacterium]